MQRHTQRRRSLAAPDCISQMVDILDLGILMYIANEDHTYIVEGIEKGYYQ